MPAVTHQMTISEPHNNAANDQYDWTFFPTRVFIPTSIGLMWRNSARRTLISFDFPSAFLLFFFKTFFLLNQLVDSV